MRTVEVGNNVKIHYVGTLTDGTEFDSSRVRGTPIAFVAGESRLLPAFENQVVGMQEGESKSFTLTTEEAYGPHNPEAINVVPRTQFPEDYLFEVGAQVQGTSPVGSPVFAKIESFTDNDVTLDMNHPLAGKDLTFEVEIVEIAE
jgi:peptidylprolyl isomerase